MKYAFQHLQPEHMGQRRTLYVIECQGRFKVGLATDVACRLAELQKGCPFPLELRLRRSVTRASAIWVERMAHDALRAYHLHGEWFDAPFETVRAAALTAAKGGQARINTAARKALKERAVIGNNRTQLERSTAN